MALGYDKRPVYQNLLLGLTFEEMIGAEAFDRGKPHHTCALHGTPPVWTALPNGQPYLEFDPTGIDFLDCCAGAGSDLNFQAGDFSMAVWVNVDDITIDRTLLCRGLVDTSGWYFFISNTNGRFGLATCQATPATQASFGGVNDIVVGVWVLAGATRSGANVNLYSNGQLTTDVPDTHIDPDSSALELHIGVLNDETSEPFDGKMAYPRIWGRELSDDDMLFLFETERHLFGV